MTGCYVPLCSRGIPACQLPDEFRAPERTFAPRLNLAKLSVPAPADYIVGPNDTLEVTVPGLFEGAEIRPIRARIMADETITLPLIGQLKIGGMNLSQIQDAVNNKYADGFLVNPRVSVALAEKHAIDVSVIGYVTTPGVYQLPRYQNDVAHALALAGGMLDVAAEQVEVHRRIPAEEFYSRFGTARQETAPPPEPTPESADGAAESPEASKSTKKRSNVVSMASFLQAGPPMPAPQAPATADEVEVVLHIPLRGGQVTLSYEGGTIVPDKLLQEDVTLVSGDVVVVPRKSDEVFFVVGPLNPANVVNFRVQERDRELGVAFLIPTNRDIDVVTAVAMAGYIDPIDSPSTVTVHRSIPGCSPLLMRVDLIKARYDWNENLYVQPGDIIYLNPDASWWFRRTFDRIVPVLITAPYVRGIERWIPLDNGGNNGGTL